ncbi:MAG TPA: DUF4199 domain-containing protein [Flavobacterium sp.]|jgi:hypothetical protein|uniref:DUF4199 domain-containing protein n=1 Tax=Flavobacterium sp. TaxID=239 RepID=UPI002BEC2DD0|nr:DUF4199 domain-containing protein [Flavobacterium sp.]HPW97310.1 DUF4199 domain-containing protein [Flavobacterium sp.]HQA73365.1 DUF4199 domain-containing protein [Flavobacterium sp.]
MENQTSPAKSALSYGLFFGLIMGIELILGYVLNIDPQTNSTYGIAINVLNYLALPFIFIYIACNNYKNKLNNGFITFGQCLKIGVLVCVIAALVYGVFYTIFQLFVPEYFNGMLDKMDKILRDKNAEMTQEQIDMAISMTKKFMSPAIAVPITIAIFAFVGLLHSLLVGAIVKKDPINQSF